MSNETRKKEELLKSISDLLDETIKEYEDLVKSEIRMQPDENGGMAAEAKQEGDDAMKPLKKEGEEEEEEKEEEKEPEKKEEELEKEEEEEEKEEEKEPEKEEEEKKEPPFEKSEDDAKLEKAVEKCLLKLFDRYGLTDGVAKSEKTEKIEKSDSEEPKEEPKEEGRLDKIEKSIESLMETVEKIAKRPAGPRRSLDGLGFLQKSEEDMPGKEAPSKAETLDKLLELQKGGDKRVNTQLITRFEQEGDVKLLEDRGIKI